MSSKYLLNEKQHLLNHIGLEQAWGWSPAVDFCSLLEGRLPLPLAATESGTSEKRDHMDPTLAVKESIPAGGGDGEKTVFSPKSKDEIEFELLLQGVTLDRRVKGKPQALSSTGGGTLSSPKNEDERKERNESANEKDHQQKGGSHSGAGRETHILLAGANDIRHVLRTISQVRLKEREEVEKKKEERKKEEEKEKEVPPVSDATRETNEKRRKESTEGSASLGVSSGASSSSPIADGAAEMTYHFYFYEPNLRLHCRHLFFLQWLLNSMFSFEQLEERVLMFLDVFGNSLIRKSTAAQMRQVVQDLLRGMEKEEDAFGGSRGKDEKSIVSFTSFSEMKLKERDFLESQLRHWGRDASEAAIQEQWIQRLRQDMADRFDNRNNIIDWDFVFHLTDYTNLVKFPEYRDWRNTGVAFDVAHINPRRGFEYLYDTPNKTLCHFDRQGRGNYCGDVKNGPFFCFGSQTLNKAICQRTADGTCKYGNGVIAMHNIRAWCYTLMTGLPWPWSDHRFAWDDDKNYNYLPPGTPQHTEYQLQFPSVKFHFVGLNLTSFLRHVEEDRIPHFDAAFVGSSVLHELTPSFFSCFKPHAVIVAETAKFILDVEEEGKVLFSKRILESANACGWSHNVRLTARLHDGQPAPKKEANEGSESKVEEIGKKRYAIPHPK